MERDHSFREASEETGRAEPLASEQQARRAEMAGVLRPTAFPADRSELLGVAAGEHADEELLSLLRRLPDGPVWEHFSDMWEALGGTPRSDDEWQP